MPSRLALLLPATLLLAVGCGTPPGTLGTELAAYLARVQAWAPTEAETARTIRRILDTQFVDEAEVRRQIRDSRPRIVAHLERARTYVPHAAPLAKIHGRYLHAWEELLGGYDAIEQGFASGDFTRLARGREAMAAWRRDIAGVAADLRELRQRVEPADDATPS